MKDLATSVDVAPRRIWSWENNEHAPVPETVDLLARVLGFPKPFFYLDDPPELHTSAVSFRALSRMSAKQRNAAEAAGVFSVELANWIDRQFSLPVVDVPDLRASDPVGAAEIVRAVWGLGAGPIRNVVHLLESRGVRVFSVAEDCAEVDAFSFWDQGRPFVLLNTMKSAERSRFDAAHELAHLVLHRHIELNQRKVETDANQFAAAFLMPEGGVRASAVPNASLASIHREKVRWGVAAMAYTRRLHDLDYLTEWHYRRRCQALSAKGYRSAEQGSERPRETSQVLGKVFRTLRDAGLSRTDVADQLAIPADELRALVFGLVLTSLAGGGRSGPPRSDHLQQVK